MSFNVQMFFLFVLFVLSVQWRRSLFPIRYSRPTRNMRTLRYLRCLLFFFHFFVINIIVSLSISFLFFPIKNVRWHKYNASRFWGPSKKDFGWRGFVAKLICWSTLILGFLVANYPRWWRRKAWTGPRENSPVRFPLCTLNEIHGCRYPRVHYTVSHTHSFTRYYGHVVETIVIRRPSEWRKVVGHCTPMLPIFPPTCFTPYILI